MDLIDRYIHQVGRYLPNKQRADTQSDLCSSLLDSLGVEKENDADEEEIVAILKELGPPQQVAATYRPADQFLIGPALYPFFRMVVGVVLVALTGALLLSLGINVFIGQAPPNLLQPAFIFEFIANLFTSLMSAFGMTVLIFAILQRIGVRPDTEEGEWDPRTLPPIEDTSMVDRRGTVIEITVSLAFLALLWFLPTKIGTVVSSGRGIIITPVIKDYLPWISAALLITIVLDLVILREGCWTVLTRIAKIGSNLFSIYVLYLLVSGHSAWLSQLGGMGGLFAPIEALSSGFMPQAEAIQLITMQAFRLAFTVALIVILIETGVLVYRLLKDVLTGKNEALEVGR